MTAQSKIVEINRSAGDLGHSEAVEPVDVSVEEAGTFAADEAPYAEEYWEEHPASHRNWGKISVLSAISLAAIGWTGFFIWAHLSEIQGHIVPARISEMIVQWSAPMAVLGLLWLLAMRLSSTEAKRFGDVAALLRMESQSLEERMRTVNGEIAIARSFLAENAKELESVGRLSAQRLTEAAGQLSIALTESDERAKMLQVASNAAVSNLEQLRNHLPVVTSAAKDATNQIGIAGNTAHGQVQAILATLTKMDESAGEVGTVFQALDKQISASAANLVAKVDASTQSLAASVENSEQRTEKLVSALSASAVEAEERLCAMADDLDGRMNISHQRLEANLTGLGDAIAHLEAVADAQDSSSKALLERVKASIAECRSELNGFGDDATDRIAKLAFAVSALSERSNELGAQITSTQAQTTDLIGKASEMHDDFNAISNDVADRLSGKIDQIISRFGEVQNSFDNIARQLAGSEENTATLLNSVASLDQLIAAQKLALDHINSSSSDYLTGQQEQVDALSAAISHSRSTLEDLSGIANEQLVASLLRVRETTKQAAEASRKIVEEELSTIAEKLNEKNRHAIEEAVTDQVQALDLAMREAISRNLTLADEVESKISRQLQTVDEMASNLELRVSEVHTSFGGIDDEGFARRMALLTESLNSAAIDVAKILSNEVTDTAWAAYLKGDRGVFTRRAVKLLDNSESKIIAAHYDDDAEFRDNVNRYIHDFESMMRVLLSTRDGNAIGVTLLSSDVGKLYVALAQAIERLRN